MNKTFLTVKEAKKCPKCRQKDIEGYLTDMGTSHLYGVVCSTCGYYAHLSFSKNVSEKELIDQTVRQWNKERRNKR